MIKRIIKKIQSARPIIYTNNIPSNPNKILMNKLAIVTGGSRGIGFAISKKLIEAGAKVILTGRNITTLEKACEQLDSPNAIPYVWDVTETTKMKKKIDDIVKVYGNIDILVNNAGVVSNTDFFKITEKEYDSALDINLKGVFFMCQTVAEVMIENMKPSQGMGHILIISSEMGLRPASVPYGISKWGAVGLTKGLGQLLAPKGIVVNGIAPGAIATDMMNWSEGDSIVRSSHRNGRYGFPDEIASLATFLVSAYGDNIIGEVVASDGGSSLY